MCVSERKGRRERGRQLAKAEKVKASEAFFCCAGLEVRLSIFEQIGRDSTSFKYNSDHTYYFGMKLMLY